MGDEVFSACIIFAVFHRACCVRRESEIPGFHDLPNRRTRSAGQLTVRRPESTFARYTGVRKLAASVTEPHKPCCRAIKTRATIRSIVFLREGKARALRQSGFIGRGCALDRGQRMLELWNNWYETLASVEALATVIVIVVVAAGVISLGERWRR